MMNTIINPKHKALTPLIEDIKTHFNASNEILYNQRNIIKVITFNNKKYVVKAFKVPNALNRFAYKYLRPSKAKRSYIYSLKIGKELTPEPIAYIEETKNGLLAESYYISEFFDYDHTIHEVLINKSIDDRKEILKAFAQFTFDIHNKNILHHDYSHGNILIKRTTSGEHNYLIKIIDTNRMSFKNPSVKERLANFARIKADDNDMKTIITQYAKNMALPADKLLEDAKFYRDDFYKKRALKNKLRGKK